MIKIDKASCLCVDSRYDERKDDILDMQKRIEALGGDWETFMANTQGETAEMNHANPDDWYDIPAEDIPNLHQWGYGREGYKHHHWNALACHKVMIQRAIDEKRQNLLMIEDDAYFPERFEYIWDKVANYFNNDSYDILYFGWWISDENDEFNQNIEKKWADEGIIELDKVVQLGGLHGALVNSNMFEFLMKFPAVNPIDYQLNQYHSQLRTTYILPKIIHTRTTYSLCEGSVITRNEL